MSASNVELVHDLMKDLKEAKVSITVSATGSVKIDGEKLNTTNVFGFLQKAALGDPKYNPLMLAPASETLNQMRSSAIALSRIKAEIDGIVVQSYDFEGLIPFQSITESERFCLYDSKNDAVTDLDYKAYKQSEGPQVKIVKARIVFNPYSPKVLDFRSDDYGRPCNFLNTYKKPLWQLSSDIGVEEGKKYKPSPLFFDFMNHLFIDPKCREFVFDWLHYALTDRCETYLVLNGAKGIGKNVFSELLCKPLMGDANHKVAQPSALTSDFNALLADSRMIVFDEFKIDSPEKVNKLKRYINEAQTIERKGIDASTTVKTYNSFIISNNDQSDMRISWDDRRFSVMDLTTVKLRDAWSEEKIDELLALFEDLEEMRAIGYWLMYRDPHHTKFDDWKGPHFYALCYASFNEWQKVIIDLATSKTRAEVTVSDFKKEYRKRTDNSRIPSFVKVRDFVTNYRHEGVDPLGELLDHNFDQWTLRLNEIFQPNDVAIDDTDDGLGDLLA